MSDRRRSFRFGFLLVSCLIVLVAGHVANGDLVAHFDFEGNTNDLSGTGNNGTLINGADFAAESPFAGGQSLWLRNGDGTENQGMNIPASESLASSLFTLAYWISPAASQGNAGLERLTSRSGDLFETAVGDANAVGGTTSSTGLTLSYYQGAWNVTNVEITPDVWTHVAWVSRGAGANDMELFINGDLAFSGVGVNPEAGRPGSGLMNVGIRHNEIEGFEGYIDDFRLYNRPLSAAEVAALVPEPSSAVMAVLLAALTGFALRRRTTR